MKSSPLPSAGHLPRLEALRGIAALMVAYTHAIGGIRIDSPLSQKIKSGLSTVGNGSAAVTIFFVLSGFVLATSLDNKAAARTGGFFHFLLRRALRIWPAMLLVLLFCFAWNTIIFEPAKFDIASPGYARTWSRPAEFKDIGLDALFIQNFLNPVTWTLQVEMVAAVFFVPLWWCCRRSLAVSLLLFAASLTYFLAAPLYSYARSGFIFMFILGIQTSFGIRLLSRLKAPHWPVTIFILSLGACCLITKWIPETNAVCWVMEALAAYWVIAALAATSPEKRLYIVDNRLTRFMGRVSYSFYLWHFPILFILGGYFFSNIPAEHLVQWPNLAGSAAFLISTILAIPLAWVSYQLIERPGMKLARRLK
jgi:peptidoglycan/LPS O-acetylase OafA/YrhL